LQIADMQLPQLWSLPIAGPDDTRRARKRSFAATAELSSPTAAATTASVMQHSQPNSQQ